MRTEKPRVSLVRSIFSFFSFDGVSRIRQRGASEGLIAPRSPAPPRLAPSHIPSSPSPRPRSQYLTPPPRSPRANPDVQEVEVHLSPKVNSEFRLDTPRRRLQPNQRPMEDALGLGTGISSRSGRSLLVEDDI